MRASNNSIENMTSCTEYLKDSEYLDVSILANFIVLEIFLLQNKNIYKDLNYLSRYLEDLISQRNRESQELGLNHIVKTDMLL